MQNTLPSHLVLTLSIWASTASFVAGLSMRPSNSSPSSSAKARTGHTSSNVKTSFFTSNPPLNNTLTADNAKDLPLQVLLNGAAGRSRTGDLRITNALLYQLSYSGVGAHYKAGNPCSQPGRLLPNRKGAKTQRERKGGRINGRPFGG